MNVEFFEPSSGEKNTNIYIRIYKKKFMGLVSVFWIVAPCIFVVGYQLLTLSPFSS